MSTIPSETGVSASLGVGSETLRFAPQGIDLLVTAVLPADPDQATLQFELGTMRLTTGARQGEGGENYIYAVPDAGELTDGLSMSGSILAKVPNPVKLVEVGQLVPEALDSYFGAYAEETALLRTIENNYPEIAPFFPQAYGVGVATLEVEHGGKPVEMTIPFSLLSCSNGDTYKTWGSHSLARGDWRQWISTAKKVGYILDKVSPLVALVDLKGNNIMIDDQAQQAAGNFLSGVEVKLIDHNNTFLVGRNGQVRLPEYRYLGVTATSIHPRIMELSKDRTLTREGRELKQRWEFASMLFQQIWDDFLPHGQATDTVQFTDGRFETPLRSGEIYSEPEQLKLVFDSISTASIFENYGRVMDVLGATAMLNEVRNSPALQHFTPETTISMYLVFRKHMDSYLVEVPQATAQILAADAQLFSDTVYHELGELQTAQPGDLPTGLNLESTQAFWGDRSIAAAVKETIAYLFKHHRSGYFASNQAFVGALGRIMAAGGRQLEGSPEARLGFALWMEEVLQRSTAAIMAATGDGPFHPGTFNPYDEATHPGNNL